MGNGIHFAAGLNPLPGLQGFVNVVAGELAGLRKVRCHVYCSHAFSLLVL